jgi:(1->4)-alpha-D-glucan 1-alpha-D-glucosylmutase
MPEVRATYRLQLHAGFPLAAARALVPYLSRLGVSHLHCSPMLQARTGSTHGYDVVDPTRLNRELGTEADLAALHGELAAHGMGIILDIVPNHMAASAENPAWDDVLAHGPASRYARWFDIDWRASERELHGRVMLPVLGEPRAQALERDEIALALEDGVPRVRYFERSFPLDPLTLAPIAAAAVPNCEREIGVGHLPCESLAEIARIIRQLPRRRTTDPRLVERRREQSADALRRLRELTASEPRVARALGEVLVRYGGSDAGRARLRRLLDAQVYRLVHWRRAAREINYRRFFDVDDLVSLHMEDPEVFVQTHALVLEWQRRGWVDGFRIDHPDGLLDPAGYFARLADAAFGGAERPPVYAEKILASGERLRSEWRVAGTTGYDFLNEAESLFVSPEGFAEIERNYHRVIRQPLEFPALARHGKRLVLTSGLSVGVRRLAERLAKLAGPDRPRPGVGVGALGRAIVDTIAALRVYRTYIDERSPVPGPDDRALLVQALDEARARGRARSEALDLLAVALLGDEGPMRAPGLEGFRLRFVQRFQQLSGPAAAKGVEDTAFYAYTPLLSRNEVGGGPEAPLDRAAADFHAGNADRAERFPGTMLAVTTHDTKRTADVRARLDVLSEIPDTWARRLDHWRRLNLPHKTLVDGRRVPDPNTVQHLCQAIVGLWPLAPPGPGELDVLRERLDEYMRKAVREAKLRTTWTDPDEAYEKAVSRDVSALLSPQESPRFLDDMEQLVRDIVRPGLWNAVARTVLHLASPGVPDIYQGDELWNLALVDPDNRRPVDFDARARALDDVERGFAGAHDDRRRFLTGLADRPETGLVKLHVMRAALEARRRHPAAFRSRVYHPLAADGPAAGRLLAFGRGDGSGPGALLVAAVPRLVSARSPGGSEHDPADWTDTVLPLPAGWPREWTCVLTGERLATDASGRLRAAELFRSLPGALLLNGIAIQ